MKKDYKRKIIKEQIKQVNKIMLIEQTEIRNEHDLENYPSFDLKLEGRQLSKYYLICHNTSTKKIKNDKILKDKEVFAIVGYEEMDEGILRELWVISIDKIIGQFDSIWRKPFMNAERMIQTINNVMEYIDPENLDLSDYNPNIVMPDQIMGEEIQKLIYEHSDEDMDKWSDYQELLYDNVHDLLEEQRKIEPELQKMKNNE